MKVAMQTANLRLNRHFPLARLWNMQGWLGKALSLSVPRSRAELSVWCEVLEHCQEPHLSWVYNVNSSHSLKRNEARDSLKAEMAGYKNSI